MFKHACLHGLHDPKDCHEHGRFVTPKNLLKDCFWSDSRTLHKSGVNDSPLTAVKVAFFLSFLLSSLHPHRRHSGTHKVTLSLSLALTLTLKHPNTQTPSALSTV